jgi:BirA family biotin operon repressor/biotin-[acetyl-CoA-carboxylase] ligase
MVTAMSDAGATSPPGPTRFWDIRRFGTIGSTNAWLLDRAREGAPEGLVAVADHQTAGRGRLDRTWEAPPGTSLLASVLLRPSLDAEHLHLATAVVALAAADACRAEAGVDPDLKWPNDLLAGGHKLGGVLGEALAGSGQVEAVVVGLGINVSWPEGGAGPPEGGVALNQLVGFDVGRDRLLAALLRSLEDRYQALGDVAGQAAQASEYRRRCSTVGRLVRVELADETFTGTVADVTPEGHLLVDVGVCLRRVTAGDVVHLRPA